jgi:hypothetical protein
LRDRNPEAERAYRELRGEGVDPLVDVLAELGDLAFRDTGKAHRLYQLVDLPGSRRRRSRLPESPSPDPSRRSCAAPGKWGVRALTQLGDAQAEQGRPATNTSSQLIEWISLPTFRALGALRPRCSHHTSGPDRPLPNTGHRDLRTGYKSQRTDGTFSCEEFVYDHTRDTYRCPAGNSPSTIAGRFTTPRTGLPKAQPAPLRGQHDVQRIFLENGSALKFKYRGFEAVAGPLDLRVVAVGCPDKYD